MNETDKDYPLVYVVLLLVKAHADYFRPAALDLFAAINSYVDQGNPSMRGVAAEAGEAILFFLRHMDEEDAHFFPVIKRAVNVREYLSEERGILRRYVESLGKLGAAHIETEPHIRAMRSWIKRLEGDADAAALVKQIRAYAVMVESHMIIEETVLLPQARALLERETAV